MNPRTYFTDRELTCRCGCGLLPPIASVERLYALRILWGKPLTINSAARCATHNRTVGGANSSSHLPASSRTGLSGGQGFDIRTNNLQEQAELERLAIQCGFRGIGRASNFLHIDDANRNNIVVWQY